MSLLTRFILGGITAVIIPFIIAGIVTYTQLSNSLEHLAEDKTKQIAIDLSTLIQNALQRELNFVSAVAKNSNIIDAAAAGDFKYIQKRLEDVFHLSGAYSGALYVIDRKGIVRADTVDKKRIGLNLSDRQYFLSAKKGETGAGVTLVNRATGKTGVTIYAPMLYKNKTFTGVAVIGLDIEFILDPIAAVKLGETGYAYLANARSPAIIHPDKNHIFRTTDEDQGLKPLVNQMATNRIGTARYMFMGVKKLAGFAPIKITGWRVVVTQHIDEIMAPVRKILNMIILGGILLLIILLIIIFILSKKLSTPFQRAIESFRQLTLYSGEMVTMIGRDKRIEFVNMAMKNLLKKQSHELIGTRPVLININNIPEEEIWRTLDSYNIWTGRIIINTDSVEPVILETLIVPIQDGKGQIINYLEISRDISQELKVESRLLQAQKIEAIGTLAGGIAHDFNNILSGIFGYAELALLVNNNPDKSKKYITEVLNAAQRAKDLVRQILTFSRKTEPEFHPITPKYIITEAIKLLRASIPTTIGIRIDLKTNAVIIADPIQVHQVIVNLCTNAVHAMKDTKGIIDISLDEFDADESFSKDHPEIYPGKHIHLRVKDTGSGIKPEIIDHIFDPFFTTKPQGEGTGLGLSLIHGIVKKLNGIITVKSEINKGTTFDVILPVVLTGTETDTINLAEELPRGNERIMFLDDEEQIGEAFSAILSSIGYKVTIFTNSKLALETLQNRPDDFDILITDYTMPHFTGIDIAEKMKKLAINKPVILCSGFVYQDMEKEAFDAGISEILRKPIRPYEIAVAIRRSLNKT